MQIKWSDETIEAVARALLESSNQFSEKIGDKLGVQTWDSLQEEGRIEYLDDAKSALSAVAQCKEVGKLVGASKAYLTGVTVESKIMDAWDSARSLILSHPTCTIGREVFEMALDEIEDELREALRPFTQGE